MVWLKENREQGGSEGSHFETAWKTWCRKHDLHSLAKNQRVESIMAFRENWEAGAGRVLKERDHGAQIGLASSAGVAEGDDAGAGAVEESKKRNKIGDGPTKRSLGASSSAVADRSEDSAAADESLAAAPSGTTAWLGDSGGSGGGGSSGGQKAASNEEAMWRLLGYKSRPER